jgi:hypothetical protein
MAEHALKDGGERETCSSGMMREPENDRGRFDLISPIFLRRLAVLYERGALKYADRNWEKGMPFSRFFNSAMRHMNQFQEGHRDEDHLIQAAWNLSCIVHLLVMIERGKVPKEFNDFPNYL